MTDNQVSTLGEDPENPVEVVIIVFEQIINNYSVLYNFYPALISNLICGMTFVMQ